MKLISILENFTIEEISTYLVKRENKKAKKEFS
jgi:hypothetical protein